MNRQKIREKMPTKHLSRRARGRTQKECLQLSDTNKQSKKMGEDGNAHRKQKHVQMANKHLKRSSHLSHRGDTNQNQSEVPPHTPQNGRTATPWRERRAAETSPHRCVTQRGSRLAKAPGGLQSTRLGRRRPTAGAEKRTPTPAEDRRGARCPLGAAAVRRAGRARERGAGSGRTRPSGRAGCPRVGPGSRHRRPGRGHLLGDGHGDIPTKLCVEHEHLSKLSK